MRLLLACSQTKSYDLKGREPDGPTQHKVLENCMNGTKICPNPISKKTHLFSGLGGLRNYRKLNFVRVFSPLFEEHGYSRIT